MKKTLLTVFTSLIVCVVAQHSQAHSPDMQLNEVVHMSDAIFIGRVSEIRSFDGGGSMVGTEVVFAEIDALSTRPSARAFISEEVSLRFAGGSYGGVDISACCQPIFDVGEDYLVCTLLDGNTYLSPFSGGTQGLFRILQDDRGEMYPVTYKGRGIQKISAFNFTPTPTVNQVWQGRPIYWETPEFASTVEPPRAMTEGATSNTRRIETPESIISLEDFVTNLELARQTSIPSYITQTFGSKQALSKMQSPKSRSPLGAIKRMYDPSRGVICWCGYQSTNVVIQQVHEDWTSFDHNNWAMANYNIIVDLFRYIDSDGSWANNGDDEFCGWPTDAEITDEYSNFDGWGSAVAICFTNSIGWCGQITEADIIFNRTLSWGYDLDDTFGTDTFLYRPVVAHELGHAVGLERGHTDDSGDETGCGDESYLYDQPTAMTAAYRNIVENGKGLHALDAAGVRGIYDSDVLVLEDVGVESYYGNAGMVNASTNSTWLNDLDTLELYNVTVENVSSNSQSDIRLRVYLSTNNTISENDKKISTFSFSSMSEDSFWTGDLSMTIPQTVTTGDYYVGLIATLDGDDYWWDDYSGNNATWMPEQIHVENDGVWEFNDVIMNAQLVPYGWLNTNWWVDNSGANDDEDNGGGGICGTFGRDLWWFFDADIDGEVAIGIPNVEPAGDGQGLQAQGIDFVEIYRGFPDNGNQPVATACATAYEGPAVADITKGERYYIRIGGVNHNRITGWAQLKILPTDLVGDTPTIAIPVDEGVTFAKYPPNSTSFFGDGGPCVGGNDDLIDRWFVYTAKYGGTVEATTCGSGDIDTIIGVFTPGLVPVTCNDDSVESCVSGNTQTSTVYWDTEEGMTFLIQVLANPFDQPEFDLTVSLQTANQTNNSCDSPMSVEASTVPFTTRGASTSGTHDCSGNPIGCDVWFKWVATDTGTASIGTCEDIGGATTFDSIVNVYDGCTMEYLLACNESACSDGSSIATVPVVKGKSYLIQVGSSTSELGGCVAGDGVLGIIIEASCLGDIDGDGSVGIDDILALISDWGTSASSSDLDQSGTVDVGDLLILIDMYGDCP